MKITVEAANLQELRVLLSQLLGQDVPQRGGHIALLGLKSLTRNALSDAGIETIEALSQMSEMQLLRLPNFGRKSLNDVRDAMIARGFNTGDWRPQDDKSAGWWSAEPSENEKQEQ
jgi:DNA-directed RNA polymerase alpha subunit